MNFNKLPKEKRQHLILIALGTAGVLFFLGYSPIRSQCESLRQLAAKRAELENKLQQIQSSVKRADQLEGDLVEMSKSMALVESDTVSGDLCDSIYTTLRRFKAKYPVNIPQFNPLSAEASVPLLADFPYKQVTMNVSGTAHFHDFGRFLADFENQFPHVRVTNLNLDLNPNPAPDQPETVRFQMEVVTLVSHKSL